MPPRARRGSWAGPVTHTQAEGPAKSVSIAARRSSFTVNALEKDKDHLEDPRFARKSDHAGMVRTIYRESRRVLAGQRRTEQGVGRWTLKEVGQAICKGAKAAITMHRVVDIFQELLAEGRARRDAQASKSAEEQAELEAKAQAEALAKAEAAANSLAAAVAAQAKAESQGNASSSGGNSATMMESISQVVDELACLGAPVENSAIDGVMRLCKDISGSLMRFADMMKAGLEALNDVSVTLDQQAVHLAGMVGRLKSEMHKLQAALQTAAEMQQDGVDREAFEVALQARRAEMQASVQTMKELRETWRQHHKDANEARERHQIEEAERLQKEQQEAQEKAKGDLTSKDSKRALPKNPFALSEQVIAQLGELEFALLNSPSKAACQGAAAFGLYDADPEETEQMVKKPLSQGDALMSSSPTEVVHRQVKLFSDEVVTEMQERNPNEGPDSLPSRSASMERVSCASDPQDWCRSPQPPEVKVWLDKIRIHSQPQESEELIAIGRSASPCNDNRARHAANINLDDPSREPGPVKSNESLTLEGKAMEGRSDTDITLDSGDDSLEKPVETKPARPPGKVLSWASSLIEELEEKEKKKARFPMDLPGRHNAEGSTGQDVAKPKGFAAALLGGHWRRVRTPPLCDRNGNEVQATAEHARAGSPISRQALANLRAGAVARRPMASDASSVAFVQERGRGACAPNDASPEVGGVDSLSIPNRGLDRGKFYSGSSASSNSTAYAQDPMPVMSARAACPPRAPGQVRRRHSISTEGGLHSARQPTRPVSDSRHVEPQRSPSPDVDTVWREALDPELGAIGRARRLQDEAWEDEFPDPGARNVPSDLPHKAKQGHSAHSNHFARDTFARQQSPRVLPPVAGAGPLDISRRGEPTNRTAKAADLQFKRQALAASSRPAGLRRASAG